VNLSSTHLYLLPKQQFAGSHRHWKAQTNVSEGIKNKNRLKVKIKRFLVYRLQRTMCGHSLTTQTRRYELNEHTTIKWKVLICHESENFLFWVSHVVRMWVSGSKGLRFESSLLTTSWYAPHETTVWTSPRRGLMRIIFLKAIFFSFFAIILFRCYSSELFVTNLACRRQPLLIYGASFSTPSGGVKVFKEHNSCIVSQGQHACFWAITRPWMGSSYIMHRCDSSNMRKNGLYCL
jgi:hypothetical protein